MTRNTIALIAVALLAAAGTARAAKSVKVPMTFITADGVGKPAGTVTLKETKDGVHLHEKGSCDPADKEGKKVAGQAAGGHFDPDATKAHKGPGGGGHKGDLPKLTVSDKGDAKAKLEAKGLKLADFDGKSLMIHAGGDNYSDTPKPLGGGGDRIVCGVVPAGK